MKYWRNPSRLLRGAAGVALRSHGARAALAAVAAICWIAADGAHAQARKAPLAAAPRVNELTLAQLRPGRNTLPDADKLFGAHNRERPDAEGSPVSFVSSCWQLLQLDSDEHKRIQVITLADLRLRDSNVADCSSWDAKDRVAMGQRWKTGRGIRLGSTRKQVLAVYGPPQSSGPSTQNDRELELLFYAFDWAGPEVPQVLEITLEAGRVVQVTLAFPSL